MKYFGEVVSENEIENVLKDILTEYAVNEILIEASPRLKQKSEEIKIKNKTNKILQYAAYSLKKDVNTQRKEKKRYDWDTITHKDYNGNLLDHISNYILSEDEITRKIESIKVLETIKNNLLQYFEEDFETKVEEEKDYYELQGNRDYFHEE